MRLGILLTEEQTTKLIEVAQWVGISEHDIITSSIDTLYKSMED